jgi:hypothetical protein
MKAKKWVRSIGIFFMLFSVSGIWTLAIADESRDAPEDKVIESTMVMQPQVHQVNGGINPEYFGYRIEGLVLKGPNDCSAVGASVAIQSYVENGILYLLPSRLVDASFDRVCPSVSQPIFQIAHIDVRYSRKEVQKIVIRNVGQDLEDMAFSP